MSTQTPAPSFGRILCRSLARKACYAAPVVALLVVGAVVKAPVEQASPPEPTPVQALIAAHDCWTGPGPDDMAGKIPGHVIVSSATGPMYAGPVGVHRAMEHAFHNRFPNLTIYAFCR